MRIEIPDYALVLLVGASGTGKSCFAEKHLLPTEVISSDRARGWVADDETDQSASADAFDIVHAVIEKRLKNRRFTVVDATNSGRGPGWKPASLDPGVRPGTAPKVTTVSPRTRYLVSIVSGPQH